MIQVIKDAVEDGLKHLSNTYKTMEFIIITIIIIEQKMIKNAKVILSYLKFKHKGLFIFLISISLIVICYNNLFINMVQLL